VILLEEEGSCDFVRGEGGYGIVMAFIKFQEPFHEKAMSPTYAETGCFS
jgi:hypothetical protein